MPDSVLTGTLRAAAERLWLKRGTFPPAQPPDADALAGRSDEGKRGQQLSAAIWEAQQAVTESLPNPEDAEVDFESTYRRYEFAPLVAFAISAAEWLARVRDRFDK